jgi:NAD(P)-dependent dehydrogenase (short-subunit alcohol dehydrogenase family)
MTISGSAASESSRAHVARTTFKKMSKGDWDSVIRTNLDSVFNMTKQVMDGMVDRGFVGSISDLVIGAWPMLRGFNLCICE